MTLCKLFGINAMLLALFFCAFGEGLAAQDCRFGNDDMDDIQRIRRCLEQFGPGSWTAENGFTLLHRAARYSSNPTVVSALLEAGFDPNARTDSVGWTPLHYATRYNENPTVHAILLDAGSNPNEPTNHGWTNLHLAVFVGNPTVVSTLLRGGADPNRSRNDGETALHMAVQQDELTVLSILLDAGADPSIRNNRGDTPFHYSIPFGNSSLVAILLDGGADPDTRDGDGEAPLHVASRFGERALVSTLLNAGANPNAITYNDDAWAPIHFAAEGYEADLVTLLIEAGADPMAKRSDGKTPLNSALVAYSSLKQDVVAALLEGGGDESLTPLHLAVLRGDATELTIALGQGSDPDAADPYGWTPLHYIALTGQSIDEPAVLDRMVAAGANANARDSNGMSPLDLLSRYGGKASAVKTLLEAGAEAGLAASAEH